MLRRRRPPDPLAGVDPAAVPPRFAAVVTDALAARSRWTEVVQARPPGPVRDRLAALQEPVDESVLEVWATVRRAVEIEQVASSLDADRTTADYKAAKRDPGADPALVEALSARFASVQRLLNAVDDAEASLRLLDARLGAAVARAAELALLSGDAAEPAHDLQQVLDELRTLRAALDAL